MQGDKRKQSVGKEEGKDVLELLEQQKKEEAEQDSNEEDKELQLSTSWWLSTHKPALRSCKEVRIRNCFKN